MFRKIVSRSNYLEMLRTAVDLKQFMRLSQIQEVICSVCICNNFINWLSINHSLEDLQTATSEIQIV